MYQAAVHTQFERIMTNKIEIIKELDQLHGRDFLDLEKCRKLKEDCDKQLQKLTAQVKI